MAALGTYAYPSTQSQSRFNYDGTATKGSTPLNLPTLPLKTPRKAGPVSEGTVKKSPSQLVQERKEYGSLYGHAERHKPKILEFQDLSAFSHHSSSIVPVDVPLFSVDPPMVTFSDFQGLQVYEASLAFRNQDKVARRVKVFPPDSAYFELMPKRSKNGISPRTANGAGDKVAPGMEMCYVVRFKPDARIDYSYDLTVITEREKFTVPIRASGGSAMLDFPDIIDFGRDCVVGHEMERTVLVRNVGDRATKFAINAGSPFSCSPPSSRIEEGGSVQVCIRFKPQRAQAYEGELVLRYGDLQAHVVLLGIARNAAVSLSHSHLTVADTYVGLETQGVVTIRNDSDVPIDFSWRLFGSVQEEQPYRYALHNQLKSEEKEETVMLPQHTDDDSDDDSGEDIGSSSSEDEKSPSSHDPLAASARERKYGAIRMAIEDDPMLFHDATFAIEPKTGRVWAHSQITCAVCFRPKEADCYTGKAFLACVGQEDRAALVMKGVGIGPKATFSYDELDVANVFVDSIHRYEVQLLNQGDVAVDFRLRTDAGNRYNNMFKFTPDSGLIKVGGSADITVDFKPTELGVFFCLFEWVLKGSATSVTLGFRGVVVQPTFDFDTTRINFGTVSYGFLNSRMLTLTNTSEVPMNYTLHVPGDEDSGEFEIVPSKGLLKPSCVQRVQLDFISTTEKTYHDHKLAVDLEGIGKEVYSIPITAQCAVPTVNLEPRDVIHYGDVFLRYPFHQRLYLHNTSNLPAKFEVLAPDDTSKAAFEPDQWTGSLPPCASHVITLTLTTHTQGPVKMTVYVRIIGRTEAVPLVLTANSIGPRVVVDPPVLDWGNVKCLEPCTRHVKITNNSCIEASVRAFMADRKSLWTIHPKVIHMAPQEALQVAMTLRIDETSAVQDWLHLVVHEGTDLQVQVKGKGTETPVVCDQDLGCVDFGTLFTTHQMSHEVLVKNYGRCARRISWQREKDPKESKRVALLSPEEQAALPPTPVIFRVDPEAAIIEPKSAFRFNFVASSLQPGVFEDFVACTEKLDKGANAGKRVFRPQMKACFVVPQLTPSRSEVPFNFRFEHLDKMIETMSEPLTLENRGPLDVSFKAVVKYPFSVSVEEGTIPPGGTLDLTVYFDPAYKTDRKCGTWRERLVIHYEDHPATNVVELIGNLIWPNLDLDTTKLDFGTILNHTSKAMEVRLKNPTDLVVSYKWCLAHKSIDAENQIQLGATSATSTSHRGSPALGGSPHDTKTSFKSTTVGARTGQWLSTSTQNMDGEPGSTTHADMQPDQIELNQVFDLLPIFGTLAPGESQTAIFTFTGLQDRAFRAYAVCAVDGGPEYEVMLRGAATAGKFSIDKQELDFGEIPFTEVGDAELNLTNTGKRALSFNFNLVRMSRPNVVEFTPSSGVLEPDAKGQKNTQKITARFRAGIPADVVEIVLVEVAQFEPVVLKIVGRGTFPGVVLALPRLQEQEHRIALAAARSRLRPGDSGNETVIPQSSTVVPEISDTAAGQDTTSHASADGCAETAVEPQPIFVEMEGEYNALDPEVDLEFEVDRHYLCEALLQTPEKSAPNSLRAQQSRSAFGKSQKKVDQSPPVTAAQYRLDFGNMALGHSARRDIRIFNAGNESVALVMDKKLLKEHGFHPDPEAIPRLSPQQAVTVALTATRAKDAPEGTAELEWDLPVRGGPSYKIFVSANFVLPDLVLSAKSLDFGRVLLGRKKYMSLELKNQKAVPVEWTVEEPRDRIGKLLAPQERMFQVSPTSGVLQPNESLVLTVSFTPREARSLSEAVKLRITDNAKPKTIQVMGKGEKVRLQLQPATSYELGPVMPNQEALCELILHNPTDYPIEIYSMELDKHYLEEEQMLRKYDGYENGLAELPVRSAGAGCWSEVVQRVEEIKAAEEPPPEDEAEGSANEADGVQAPVAPAVEAEAPTPVEEGEGAPAEDEAEQLADEELKEAEMLTPEELPLPEPREVQLVSVPQERAVGVAPSLFSILTPILEPKQVEVEDVPEFVSEKKEDGKAANKEKMSKAEREKAEKEKAAKEKAEKERLEKEKAEKERLEKEKAEKAAVKSATGEIEAPGEGEGDTASQEEAVEEVEMVERIVEDRTRWIIEKGQQQRLLVKFMSPEVANICSLFKFAIVDDVSGNPVSVSIRGVAALPGINVDPKAIFSRRKRKRPEGGYGSKCFISSLGVYDFGPLLAGRDAESRRGPQSSQAVKDENKEAEPTQKDQRMIEAGGGDTSADEATEPVPKNPLPPVSAGVRRHMEVIHLTNDSLFPADVQLSLASKTKIQEQAAESPPQKKAGKKDEPPKVGAVYIVEPESLHLEKGEVADVRIWCFPPEDGVCEDTLLAQVEHNTEPVSFGLCAVGTTATATLDKEEVEFGRLLGNVAAEPQIVKIKNQSALPTKFQLVCLESKVVEGDAKETNGKESGKDKGDAKDKAESKKQQQQQQQQVAADNAAVVADSGPKIPPEFTVSCLEGTLAANEEREIQVGFRGLNPAKFTFAMGLQVKDCEGLRGWQDSGRLAISAETFAVTVVVEPDPVEKVLDFGTVLVGGSEQRSFEVVNKGKYVVRFQLGIRRSVSDLLVIDTRSGELQPEGKAVVNVTCSPKRVMDISAGDAIVLQILDSASGDTINHNIPPMRVALSAVYNSFQATPPRGLNFGPVEHGDAQTKTFSVRNTGIFQFDWSLFNATDPPTFGENGRPPPPPATLQAGQFSVTPTSGKLQPEEEVSVNVTFKASGDRDEESKLSIWVDGAGVDGTLVAPAMSPTAPPRGSTATGASPNGRLRQHKVENGKGDAVVAPPLGTSTYLLTGQSCVPGLNTTDLQVIFEEQFYARNLEDAHLIAGRADIRVFCEEDKIFSFGPTLVYESASGPSPSLAKPAGPVVEKLRLTNPKAVPCKVQLKVKPRDSDAPQAAGGKKEKGGKATTPDSNLPFQVQPVELVLAPHDSQQVEISFQPPHLASFAAVFEATVVSGTDPQTNLLRFDLRGEGTVPATALEGVEHLRDDEGNVLQPGEEKPAPKLKREKSKEHRGATKAAEPVEPAEPEPPQPPTFVCEHSSIPFASTVMFAKKMFRFVVKNTSTRSGPFAWRIAGETASSFEISPMSGNINPGAEAEFQVRFAPTECENFDCSLKCVWTVDPEVEPLLLMPLTGTAVRPWCHIDLEPSTYQSKRDAGVPLDPKYSVVEIISLGTRVKNTKRFYVYNPTGEPYDFSWMREVPTAAGGGPEAGDDDPFRCLTKRGTIQPRKKYEMVFEFCPMTQETRESFWIFSLIGPKVDQHFLIAGTVTEPRVGFDVPGLNFGERLLEGAATERVRLVNKEHIPFSFAIDASSFQSGQADDCRALSISPMTGVVGPDSTAELMATFKPQEEKAFNFNVVCNIKRKQDPVTLNIKGVGLKIHAAMSVEEQSGQPRRVLNAGVMESVDFGILQVHEERTMTLYLRNESKRNFNFRALVQAASGRKAKPVLRDHLDSTPPFLRITPPEGVAPHHEETPIQITYLPREVHRLDGTVLQIAIPSGPSEETFSMNLGGGARRSRVELSFTTYDFGPCFLAGGGPGETVAGERLRLADSEGGQNQECVELIATNRDDSDCMITTTFQRESWLDVQLDGAIIEANSFLKIPIVFTPREVIDYMQRVEFVVNDFTRLSVDVRGKGSPLRLELLEPEMQNVEFGVTTGGQSMTRRFSVVNRSARQVTFELVEEKTELSDKGISWSLAKPTTLKPRETLDIEIYFKPVTRVAPFRLPLFAKLENGVEVRRLLQIAGTCHATEMRFSEHSLSFGDVVVGSNAARTVRLQNFGDLGSKFRFEVAARYKQLFTVTPEEGFVRPQEEISVVMNFQPDAQRMQDYLRNKDRNPVARRSNKPQAPPQQATPQDVRIAMKDMKCILTDHPPLTLDVYARAVSEPGETKLLQFSTEVRKQEVKSFTVANPTQADWKLRPQVSTLEPPGHTFWTCAPEVVIPAGKDVAIDVTYMPLVMTANADTPEAAKAQRCEKHRGTIFIGAPNGSAMMYNLEGVAKPPKVDRRIEVQVPCKKQHIQTVPLKNWLQEKQRFDVKVELVEPDPSSNAAMGIVLHGVPTMDLPPALEREYKFNIYSYQEGSALCRVTFSRSETKEFVVMEVALKFVAVDSLGTINLEAACRQLVRHKIVVANPLDSQAKFSGTCTNPHVLFSPATLEVPPRSEGSLELLYRPLEEGAGEAVVSLQSAELGRYPYTLKWKATAPAMERTLVLKAPLGGSVVETFKFLHFARQQVSYEARIDATANKAGGPVSDFVVENSPAKAEAAAEGGSEVSMNVRFQPSALGESRSVLVVRGANGGEYKAMIVGHAQPPQPQGPISILNGKQAPVEFRNPLSQATDFTFQLDSASFTIPMRQQRVDANKTISIAVSFKGAKQEGGRLMISCDKVPTPWVVFLKGEA